MGVTPPNIGSLSSPTAAVAPPSTNSSSSSADEASKKIRKPYTITKSRESWTEPEHDKFLEALQLFDRDWKKIEAFIGSKIVIQENDGIYIALYQITHRSSIRRYTIWIASSMRIAAPIPPSTAAPIPPSIAPVMVICSLENPKRNVLRMEPRAVGQNQTRFTDDNTRLVETKINTTMKIWITFVKSGPFM